MTIRKPKLTKLAVMGMAVASAVFVFALGATSFATPSKNTTTHVTNMVKIPGGTMTIAEAPGAGPNYVFPMMGLQHFSVSNFDLIYMMFRPLYWFGVGNTAALNAGLSVADLPIYSNNGRTVTIKMKGYKWRNGETVDAQDVVFWMNMVKADATSWAGYAPGSGQYPGNVTNVVADNATDTVTFTLDAAYSSYWFTYNELSQITPLPIAWDITSAGAKPGSGGCSGASYASVVAPISAATGALTDVSSSAKACAAVFAFLSGKTEAGALGTYTTNPLWQIVDGPFHLASYDATDGGTTLVPNKAYSGPVKPSIDKLVMAPFTTDAAEFNVLASGDKINIGYVPPQDVPVYKGKPWCASGPCAGANNSQLAADYNLAPVYGWAVSYSPLNFTNPTAGPIFKQLYIRQAMQSLVNQSLWIQLYMGGYGVPTYGPVPVLPPTDFASPQETANPYPYNPSHAKALLMSHGWNVVPDGITTCVNPGTKSNECGADIPKNAPLNFTYLYYNGVVSFNSLIQELQSSWAQVGIKLQLEGKAAGAIFSVVLPCAAGKACPWEIVNWQGGWDYAPDYYPTGEEIFTTGAGSNAGGYSDPTANKLIVATNHSSSLSSLYTYQNYLSQQLPVIWQPNAAAGLTEIGKNVCGVLPQNVLLSWVAEDWYFCKAVK
ncbi:MAG: ABC transporter substrate-binding protein [Acidimicrobiales bacterium]|jgi:peptide/nickel transport system substrate-binding protein